MPAGSGFMGTCRGPLEAHLAARHGVRGWRKEEGREAERRRFPLFDHVGGGHVVLVEVVEGAWSSHMGLCCTWKPGVVGVRGEEGLVSRTRSAASSPRTGGRWLCCW